MVDGIKCLFEVKEYSTDTWGLVQQTLNFFDEHTVGCLSGVVCPETELHRMK